MHNYDSFDNNTFNYSDWSATAFFKAEDIKNGLSRHKLVGRKIQCFKFLGINYALTRNCIEDTAFFTLKNLNSDHADMLSYYDNIPAHLNFDRFARIEEPFMISFDDGDTFEIDTPDDFIFQFSMNKLPYNLKPSVDKPNIRADDLFSVCLNKTITEIQIDTVFSSLNQNEYHPATDEQIEVVPHITIWLENEIGLRISQYLGFCEITCIDKNEKAVTIQFAQLKENLFNFEDCHLDTTVNYMAKSPAVFFNRGFCSASVFFISSKLDTKLVIEDTHLILFSLSISLVLGKQYDEYDDYSFSYDTWWEILKEALYILSLKDFDALFDYVTEKSKNKLLYYINNNGKEFYDCKELYKTQLEDVINWTTLVLSERDTMHIYGY